MDKIADNNFSLIIYSDMSYLEDVEHFLNKIFNEVKISRTKFKRLLLCISEGVSNAIIHGNNNQNDRSVKINIKFDGCETLVTIQDEGKGFNHEEIPNPTCNENIKKEKGRGLHIIKTYAKEVTFENKGNILKIKFDLSVEDTVLQ